MNIERLKKKSIDSFLLALEIYNKPTIDYRLEGCVFFLCNAWELLLKAKLIDTEGIDKIYYKDSNRTLTLSDCVSKVMTNDKDPIRKNLELIITLRNTATHFIIPEFEYTYLPFLTACVKNYSDKMYDFFNILVSDYIKGDFLSFFVGSTIKKPVDIITNYGKEIADKFNELKELTEREITEETNEKLAISVTLSIRRVSKQNKADYTYYPTNKSDDEKVKIVSKMVNPNDIYLYTFNEITKEINNEIIKHGIVFNSPYKDRNDFTTHFLQLYLNHENLKDDSNEFCYKFIVGKQTYWKYSNNLIVKFMTEIQANTDLIKDLYEKDSKKYKLKKQKIKQNKKRTNPRGKGISENFPYSY